MDGWMDGWMVRPPYAGVSESVCVCERERVVTWQMAFSEWVSPAKPPSLVPVQYRLPLSLL